MNRYEITRQEVNCGPTRSIYVETLAQAKHAFEVARSQGAIFVELFDMQNEAQLRVEYPTMRMV